MIDIKEDKIRQMYNESKNICKGIGTKENLVAERASLISLALYNEIDSLYEISEDTNLSYKKKDENDVVDIYNTVHAMCALFSLEDSNMVNKNSTGEFYFTDYGNQVMKRRKNLKK